MIIGDHLIGNRDYFAIFGDHELIVITISNDRDLTKFFSEIPLSIAITLNKSSI